MYFKACCCVNRLWPKVFRKIAYMYKYHDLDVSMLYERFETQRTNQHSNNNSNKGTSKEESNNKSAVTPYDQFSRGHSFYRMLGRRRLPARVFLRSVTWRLYRVALTCLCASVQATLCPKYDKSLLGQSYFGRCYILYGSIEVIIGNGIRWKYSIRN